MLEKKPHARRAAALAPALPEANFSEDGISRYLHLGTPWVQGAMRLDAPFDLDLEYVQRMMAWLLFVPDAGLGQRHALQLGLGAAALTKFCHKRLRMHTHAVEINPQVVAICRGWFKLPPDGARLEVIEADAAQAARRPDWQGLMSAVQVDLYDQDAGAPVLDSADFYADCRRLLSDEGSLTVNLFGRMASYERSLAQITQAFGAEAVWTFRPTREGNTVVLAQASPSRPAAAQLQARAQAIEQRWQLPARKWLRTLRPLVASAVLEADPAA
ncbi:MAG: spermidine synthase [Comamonas sp.]